MIIIVWPYSVMQSDGNSFWGDVVLDNVNKASWDEDKILNQFYKRKICSDFIMMILILSNIIMMSLYAMLKLSKTTSPQKLLSSDCITLYYLGDIPGWDKRFHPFLPWSQQTVRVFRPGAVRWCVRQIQGSSGYLPDITLKLYQIRVRRGNILWRHAPDSMESFFFWITSFF